MDPIQIDYLGWAIKLLAASGAAAWLSSWLNSKDTNTFLQFIKDVLNAVGGNIFKGKNSDDDRV